MFMIEQHNKRKL